MLISPAYAQTAAEGGGGDIFFQLMPLVLIFVVFYFLLIRPQQKKIKDHRSMVEALRRGDKIVTAGGVLGTVTKVQDNELQVEVSEGVRVRVVRSTVSEVLSKTEAADKAKGKSGSEKATQGPANDDGSKKKGLLGGLLGGGKSDK